MSESDSAIGRLGYDGAAELEPEPAGRRVEINPMKKWVNILGHVFNAGCYALHLWTVWIAYFMKGWPAMVLTLLTPLLSWIFWFFVLWIKFGFWHLYNIAVIVALIVGAIIGWMGDDLEEPGQSSQSKVEEIGRAHV